MNILAFDLGASSGKLSLGRFDGDRLSIESVHRFDNGPIGFGNGLYWDFIGIWREMLADVSARPVLAGPEEASALGNMVVQLIAMGELASIGEGRQLLGRCFAPRARAPGAAGACAGVSGLSFALRVLMRGGARRGTHVQDPDRRHYEAVSGRQGT